MNVQRALWALILAAAVLLAVVSAGVGDTPAALVSLGIGALWLALEIRGRTRGLNSLFFFGLLTLALVAALKHAAMPLTVLGLASALAAWDLSAFHRRTVRIEDDATRAALERVHLQKLSVTAGAGLLAALIPLFVQISISFVALALVLLVAVITLRSAVSSQRSKQQRN